jgi:hypothetical protein
MRLSSEPIQWGSYVVRHCVGINAAITVDAHGASFKVRAPVTAINM